MPEVFSFERRVEFCETDAAGIVHFSAYTCYMEQAEHAFWRHLGVSVMQPIGGGLHVGWPRVHVECDFRGAAKFEDVLHIKLSLLKLGSKSVEFGFGFHHLEKQIASGKIVAVCCHVAEDQPLKSVDIPADLRSKLLPYLIDN
ncbi:MAG: thioesterase family protein [Planctomycetota bacterium]|nr:thioesterase family protein [Planctomycetota bacterium]